MRKPLLLAATAAATAMLVLSSATTALAATHDVLTTGKVGGCFCLSSLSSALSR